MAATAASEVTEGPVLAFINKRLRALRKKHNRILQMEESISHGKPINKEQEDVLRSKPSISAAIEELEKLRQPLTTAVSEEIALAIHRHQQQSSVSDNAIADKDDSEKTNCEAGEGTPSGGGSVVEDLLNLLYFGSMFDVKSQNDFTATMLTRTHERGCCLTYDYVTDDATDLLGERDLDMISKLGGLLVSRPVDSSLSHKNALQQCIQHAKLWLANSDQPIEPSANASYAQMRERLNKIMASDYFTTTPEMKAPVEVAAAAAGNYASFQVPVHSVPTSVPVQAEGSFEQYEAKDEDTTNVLGHETGNNPSSSAEELQKYDLETEVQVEVMSGEQEEARPSEVEHDQKEVEPKEQQYVAWRNYQNYRGGRSSGGDYRGYSDGRGGRSGGRGGGGGGYQNGRSQYYDQPENYHPRNYYNNRGRDGRGGGHRYKNHGSAVQGGYGPADVGRAS